MKVLYNATSARVGGGLSYASQQVAALLDIDDIDLALLVAPWNREALAAVVGDRAAVRPVAVRGTAARVGWEQIVLPWVARGHDVVVSPGNMGTLLCPVPQVVVLQNSHHVGSGRRLAQNATLPRRAKIWFSHLCMRRADRVVTISRSLAQEVATERRLTGVPVTTVLSGAPAPAEVSSSSDRAARDLVGDDPFVVSVANDAPHKRLDDVADLRRVLDEGDAAVPRRIVLVGDVSAERRDILRRRAGRPDGLVFVGPVRDHATVLALFHRAAAAVTTSELEAWPLTLHEAMSQGCPVVATDIPPHREVGGSLVHYVPVGDPAMLAEAVTGVVAGPRPVPVAGGRSWSCHGVELAEVLRAVVDGSG